MPKIKIDGVDGFVDLEGEPGTPRFDADVDEIKAKHATATSPIVGPPAPGSFRATAADRLAKLTAPLPEKPFGWDVEPENPATAPVVQTGTAYDKPVAPPPGPPPAIDRFVGPLRPTDAGALAAKNFQNLTTQQSGYPNGPAPVTVSAESVVTDQPFAPVTPTGAAFDAPPPPAAGPFPVYPPLPQDAMFQHRALQHRDQLRVDNQMDAVPETDMDRLTHAVGLAPIGAAEAFGSGALKLPPTLYRAPERIGASARQLVGLNPHGQNPGPAPKDAAPGVVDKLMDRLEKSGEKIGEMEASRELENSGMLGAGVHGVAGMAPLSVLGPGGMAVYGASETLKRRQDTPLEPGESLSGRALRDLGHGAVDAATYAGLGHVLKGAPGPASAGVGLRGLATDVAKHVAKSTIEAGATMGAQAAANALVEGDPGFIKEGLEAVPGGAVFGAVASVGHLKNIEKARNAVKAVAEVEGIRATLAESREAEKRVRANIERHEATIGQPKADGALPLEGPDTFFKGPGPDVGQEQKNETQQGPKPEPENPAVGTEPAGEPVRDRVDAAPEGERRAEPGVGQPEIAQDPVGEGRPEAERSGSAAAPPEGASPGPEGVEAPVAARGAAEAKDAQAPAPGDGAGREAGTDGRAVGGEVPEGIKDAPDRRTEPRDTPDRRVAEMTDAEKTRALLTDRLTGLPNERAWTEKQAAGELGPEIVHLDLDNFKAINSSFDHKGGDAVIRAFGEAARQAGLGDVIHRISSSGAGDEFAGHFPDKAAAEQAILALRDRLLNAEVAVTDSRSGGARVLKGVDFTHGTGRDLAAADAAAARSKAERTAAGLRSGDRDSLSPQLDVRDGEGKPELDKTPAGAVEPKPERAKGPSPEAERARLHLEAVERARDEHSASGANAADKVHYDVELAKARLAHEDATRDPERPRNRREAKRTFEEVGQDPKAAEAQAAILDAHARTYAEVTGGKPDDFYKGIRILKDGSVAGGDGNVLMQTYGDVPREEVEKWIRPGDNLKSKGKQREKVIDAARKLIGNLDLEEHVAAARAGRAMRGWYDNSGKSIRHIFGDDAETFVGVLAATSPRQPVEKNLEMAIDVYEKWVRAGRPRDVATLTEMFGPVNKKNPDGSWKVTHMKSRGPNTITALTDPKAFLSGPKVEPFKRNLSGDKDAITNDSWMALLKTSDAHPFEQELFSTKAGTVAANFVMRQTADALKFEPREAQETSWSFFSTLFDMMGERGDPYQALLKMTHGDVVDHGRDFSRHVKDPDIEKRLALLGLNVDNVPGFEHKEQFDRGGKILAGEGTDPESLGRLARRAREIRDGRLTAEAESAGKPVRLPESPRVSLLHFSPREALDTLLPEKQGTGQMGAEKKRKLADPSAWAEYTNFYTETPETDVEAHRFGGKHAYRATADLTNEPGGLMNSEFRGKRSYAELKKSGFRGIVYPDGNVHLFEPTPVEYAGIAPAGGRPIRKATDMAGELVHPGHAVAEAHRDSLDEKGEGGSTTDPRTGEGPEDGYVVSPYKGRELTLDHPPTAKDVDRYIRDNRDLLDLDGNKIGTWAPGDGRHVLDVSRRVDTAHEAWKIGKENDQESYFDVAKGEVVPIGEHPPTHEAVADTLYQDDKREPFYSVVDKTVQAKMPNAASAEQLRGILSPANGVKPEELKAMGLDDFLEGKTKVTKAEVREWIDEKKIRVVPSVRGAGGADNAYKTKFGKYTLPGGENYRERLLTLPRENDELVYPGPMTELPKGYEPVLDTSQDTRFQWGVVPPGQAHAAPWAGRWHTKQAAVDAALRRLNENRNQSAADAWRARNEEKDFKAGHWDEPNVVAHTRSSDRVDADGKKVYHVEEVQSDWHQRGRENGYRSASDNDESVPDAPFKKSWPLLAMKDALGEAVRGGYDKLTWTTGEQQAERYSLAKHYDAIRAYANKDMTYDLDFRRNGENRFHSPDESQGLTPEKLEQSVGKELAKKIIDGVGEANASLGDFIEPFVLNNLDLKVGGEGLKGFYDQILPAEMNKYVKKWGGRVEATKIEAGNPVGDEAPRRAPLVTVHSLDITPAMREAILKGQPLFQADGDAAGKAKASITFDPNDPISRVIRLGKDADATSIVHEVYHGTRRMLWNAVAAAEAAGKTVAPHVRQAVDTLTKWVGAKDGEPWTVEQEEKFARGAENYHATRDAPTTALKSAFDTLRNLFKKVYGDLKGTPIEMDLPDNARKALDAINGAGRPESGVEKTGTVGAMEATGEPADAGERPAGMPPPKENLSEFANQKDIFGGYGHNQLVMADEKSAGLARFVASASAKAKAMIDQVTPEMADVLVGKNASRADRKSAVGAVLGTLAESRVRGVREKADDIAEKVAEMAPDELRAAIEQGHFDTLLDALEGRKGFEDRDLQDEWNQKIKNIENAEGKLFVHNDAREEAFGTGDKAETAEAIGIARDFLAETIKTWRDGIAPTMADETFQAHLADPKFKKAVEIYKARVEAPMRRAHAANEGVFTDHLGPLDTYFPLSNLNEKAEGQRTDKTVAYRKPKNANNFFATGLGEYDTSTEALKKNLGRAISQNGKAGLLTSLQESELMRPLKRGLDVPKTMTWRGVEYTAKPVEMGVTQMISSNGKVTRVPGQKALVPEWLHRELKPLLEPEHGEKFFRGVKHALDGITSMNLGGPTDAVYHSANLLGTLALHAPIVGTDIISKGLSFVPLVKSVAAIANAMRIDPTAPEHAARVTRMIENGQMPSRWGSSTYGKKYAEMTGAEYGGLRKPWHESEAEDAKDLPIVGKHRGRLPIDFAPIIFGPKGVDARARILMDIIGEHIAKDSGLEWTDQRAFDWTRHMGTYISTLQGRIERGAKATGLSPFYTAGRQMNVNGITGMLGVNELPVGDGIKNQVFNKYRAAQATSGLIGITALWAVMNKLYRDRWPWQDDESRLWQIALRPEHRDSVVGRAMFGDDVSKTAYVNLAGLNALMARGARLTGVKAGLEGALAGRDATASADRAQVDILNGWMHPFIGPPVHGLVAGVFGKEMYLDKLNSMRDYSSAPTEKGPLGMAQRLGRAAAGSNPVVHRVHQAHEEGAPAARVVVDTFLPNMVKGPYRANESPLGHYLKDYAKEHPFGGKKLSTDELQGRDKITGWTSRLRSAQENKDAVREAKVRAEMDAASTAGTLKDEDYDKIEKNAGMPKNAAAFSRLPLANAIEAFERATPRERTELEDYLLKKKEDPNLSEDENKKLIDRIDELLK